MKTKTTLILLILMIGLLIPKESFPQGFGEYHAMPVIINDTLTRDYLLYEPMGYTPGEEWPLVLVFHGLGNYPYQAVERTEMYMVADTAKFFVIYPRGKNVQLGPYGDPKIGWNVPGAGYIAPQDDLLYVDLLLDDIIAHPDFGIDTNRIFVTGGSNGGEMTFYLACALSDRIASFAGIIASMAYNMMDSICTPDRPTSILHMQGTADNAFPVGGNTWCPPLEVTSQYWAAVDNCDTLPTITYLPDIDPGDSCTITLLTYDSCYTSYEVFCYRIEGGIHAWPGGQFAGMYPGVNNDIHTSSEIWKFFLRNPHPRLYGFCMPEGVVFTNQQEIDAFPLNRPNCSEIEGNVVIKGDNITDLSGLSNITIIGGNLEIGQDLGSWGGQGNASLTSLTGLDNVTGIGGDLFIGFNESLPDLTGLEGLTSMDGDLSIVENDVMTSLNGIENIDAASINGLFIHENPFLSECDITSICSYLLSPGGTVMIYDNAMGCNDSSQILYECVIGVDELEPFANLIVSPNPSSGKLTLRYSISDIRYSIFELYSIEGMKVKTLLDQVQQAGEHEMTFDISDLPAGMYFVRMQIGKQVEMVKLIKVGSGQ